MTIPEIRNYKQIVYKHETASGIFSFPGTYKVGERSRLQYKDECDEWVDIPTTYDYIYLDKDK